MTSPIPFGPYSGVQKYAKVLPAHVPPKDQDRVAAYDTYRQLYWNHVGAVKVMNRGLDSGDDPVYVPSSRVVIDTMDRYVGTNLTYQVDPLTGTPESIAETVAYLDGLFARERFASRYAANKLEGLKTGDWGWYLVGDPLKPEGGRISILPLNPDTYFPTYEDELTEDGSGDPDKLVQVRLVDLVTVGENEFARVQLYDKWLGGNNPSGVIWSSVELWKPEEWFDPEKSAQVTLTPAYQLDARITAFPIYHIPNGLDLRNPPYGSSEVRGLATVLEALNQSATDSDLALALMGLGVYGTTEPGAPINSQGVATDWFIYPGAVIANSHGLHKVEGITSITPYNDHIARLEGWLADATGATDAARGRIEVSEAESGIALTLRLAPTLAKADVKDRIILDVHNQMFYDLITMWLPVYEGKNFTDVTLKAVLGDKMPVNRAAEVELVNALVLTKIMSAASARKYLTSKGFGGMFDKQEGELVLAEASSIAVAEGGQEGALDARDEEEAGIPNA
jgi:hypothetical protein